MSSNTGTAQNEEQSFSIQPHPATTNDPSTDPALTGSQTAEHVGKPGVFVPDASKLEEPKSKEELKAKSAALNAE